jgi:ribosomal protein S16
MFLNNKKIRQKIIRLRKKGIKYYPIYDIIVTYKDNRNRGFFIEKLGFFNPHFKNKEFYINSYRLSY